MAKVTFYSYTKFLIFNAVLIRLATYAMAYFQKQSLLWLQLKTVVKYYQAFNITDTNVYQILFHVICFLVEL